MFHAIPQSALSSVIAVRLSRSKRKGESQNFTSAIIASVSLVQNVALTHVIVNQGRIYLHSMLVSFKHIFQDYGSDHNLH